MKYKANIRMPTDWERPFWDSETVVPPYHLISFEGNDEEELLHNLAEILNVSVEVKPKKTECGAV